MRKIILAILGILIIVGAVYLGDYLIEKNQKPRPKFKKQIKTVFVENVVNKEIPIILTASGNLTAKNKIDLFSEVQGVLKPSRKAFKVGTKYYKRETLLSINNDEFYASLQSQKSNLNNLITAILPDLRLDYPSEFSKWENYLKGFKMNTATPKLPAFSSDKEKYFISGRGILTAYYNVKNLEVRLSKYQIKAPFSGILTEALVSPGTLVRVGQKLGEFIDTTVYELELAIGKTFSDLLQIGENVKLKTPDGDSTYTGKVTRINGRIDQATQTIKVFVEVRGKTLKEGMYLEAQLEAKDEPNAIKISRKLLIDESEIFIIKDSIF